MSGCVICCERPKKNVGPQKKIGGRKKNWGGRKNYLAAEHDNEAAPKKKKKPRFFRLGAEKYDFRAPKEQRPRHQNKSRLVTIYTVFLG